MSMKMICGLLMIFAVIACSSEVEMPEFVTNEPEQIEDFSQKAIEEAQLLLDSLEKTPVLNTEI